MVSKRLQYEALSASRLDEFHALVQDDHVRRYLMDGQLFPREWSAERIRDSVQLFQRRGVGLWLARDRTSGELVGFCGFLEIPSLHPEPQLVYAMFERFTGAGRAREMARTMIGEARRHPGFSTIVAGVDAVNLASLRVLENLGFKRVSTVPGTFGDTYLMLLDS